jgi:hypothetical protein
MIADALVQVEAHREPERGSEIDPRRAFQRRRGVEFTKAAHGPDYSGGMKWRLLMLVLLLAACSKVTQENYQKIEEGMTEEQVVALLGKPTETNSVSVLGVSGSVSRWVADDAVITVRLVNGKVGIKSFDKPTRK